MIQLFFGYIFAAGPCPEYCKQYNGVCVRVCVCVCVFSTGTPRGQSPSVMSLCQSDLRGVGEKCVCVSLCHWGGGGMLA